jgi:flavorubredoxin
VADVHEIADGIFRISSFVPQAPVEFTQFLIRDERPLLFHTGARALFPDTREAVDKVLGDASGLRYVSWSHLESDECGAVNEFLAVAPSAEPVHGQVSALIGNGDFFDRPAKAMQDGDTLDLGAKKLRFLITPHVPHAWDAIMVFEETTRTLFCSDLFTVFGKPPATTEDDVVEQSMAALRQLPGYLPIGAHTAQVFDRLEGLDPAVLAGHHSSAITGNAVQALRDLRGELFREFGMPSNGA